MQHTTASASSAVAKHAPAHDAGADDAHAVDIGAHAACPRWVFVQRVTSQSTFIPPAKCFIWNDIFCVEYLQMDL
jgi:hypothetical protein